MKLVFFFIIFSVTMLVLASGYSVFDCGWSWPVYYNDSVASMELFQKWLYAWQHKCSMPKYNPPATNNMPFASSIQTAVHAFLTAIELGQVYRPQGGKGLQQWHWADEDPNSCSVHIQSVDCFSKPLSCCDADCSNDVEPPGTDVTNFSPTGMDSCSLGYKTKKSLQWVHGQLLHYILRPRTDIHADIMTKFNKVFEAQHLSHLRHTVHTAFKKRDESVDPVVELSQRKVSTIGVFVRGGLQNAKRKMHEFDAYMVYVDQKAAELAGMGRPVSIVYVCSDRQSIMGIDAADLTEKFPNRTFAFKTLEHVRFDFDYEIPEFMADKWKSKLTVPSNRQIYTEYLADFEILASVDVFISSYSSVYPLVAALRIARHSIILPHNSSCFLNNRDFSDKPPLYCEGVNLQTRDLWVDYFGGYKNDAAFL